MDIVAPSPTSVYRYYDLHGLLLYVGITSRGTQRNREHNATKEWWSFVHRQNVDHFATRTEALSHEKALIVKFHPPFNKQHNPDHEAMRALYFAQGHVASRVTPQENKVSRSARTLLSITEHRLPLIRAAREPGGATYVASKRLAPLAEAVVWRPGVLLRSSTHTGMLAAVERVDGKRAFRFTTQSREPLPGHLVLKLRVTKDPFTIYIYEAVAA